MKRFLPLALVALAFAAVPVALADNGTPAPNAPSAQQGTGHGSRLALLARRLHRAEARFVRHCGAGASTAPAGCAAFAQRLEQRLQKLDTRLQKRIQTIRTTCTATSTDPRCAHADRRLAVLQKLDGKVQELSQKLQDWLKA